MNRESRASGKGFAGHPKTLLTSYLASQSQVKVDRAEEGRLVAAARRGDSRALERLLKSVSGTVYRFGKTFCRDPHDAEDTLQDVLVALVRSLGEFRGEAALSTWAFTVARRVCMRRRRLGERTDSFESNAGRSALAVPDATASPAHDAERAELRRALQRGIAALPAAQRDVLLLRDVEGKSAAEVGRALRLGERAVKSRLHRARLALRETMAPWAAAAGPAPGPDCPDIARMLSRYVEGELTPGVCATLEAHVNGCASCGGNGEALLEALGACRQWGEARMPREAQATVYAAIRSVVAECAPDRRAARARRPRVVRPRAKS